MVRVIVSSERSDKRSSSMGVVVVVRVVMRDWRGTGKDGEAVDKASKRSGCEVKTMQEGWSRSFETRFLKVLVRVVLRSSDGFCT